MSKYTNVVRSRVKPGQQEEFERIFKASDKWDGMLRHILAKTSEQSYVAYGLWESEEDMKTAMPQMIALLDSSRHLLEELSPHLGITDPVSGTVVLQV